MRSQILSSSTDGKWWEVAQIYTFYVLVNLFLCVTQSEYIFKEFLAVNMVTLTTKPITPKA